MKIFWWIVGAIAVTALIAGVKTAAVVTHTAASTSGQTTGLVVGGVPSFVGGFRQGFAAGSGGGGGGTSWTGPNTSWQGLQQQPHRKTGPGAVAPAKQPHRAHHAPAKRHHSGRAGV